MTIRHRFWIKFSASVIAAALLTGCMAPQQARRMGEPQRAPNISRPLISGASVITPYNASSLTAAEEALLANQKVVRVGLLLPLTGRSAELGRALQDAAAVSLFDSRRYVWN
jgi:uncharacterized lipoprotein YajG